MTQSGPETLGNVFEGFFFEVPEYQRYYSWDKEQLDDLWTDLVTLPEGKDHYFGTVILQETPTDANRTPEREWAEEQEKHLIIDGQQRITTVSILLAVLLEEAREVVDDLDEPEEWRTSSANIAQQWLVDEGLYRLHLQGDDGPFFRDHVIEAKEFPEPDTPSERRIAEAKAFFREKFQELRDEMEPGEFIRTCHDLRRTISDLEVMVHYIGADDSEKATRIFESENDRGKPLSLLERTKSFLMYMTYRTGEEGDGSYKRTIDQVQSSFAGIYEHMQSIEDAPRDSPSEDAVQRYHYIGYADWGTRNEYTGSSMLNSLKTSIREAHAEDRNECLELIDDYHRSLERAFKNLDELLNYADWDEIHERLRRIYTLGNEARFYPLLIHAWEGYSDEPADMTRLLDMIETAIVRLYAIGGHPSHAKRNRFHRIARDSDSNTDVDEWRREIADAVGDFEDDDSFRRVLKSQNFYSDQQSDQIRYLLYFYERYLCEEDGEPDVHDFDTVMGDDYEVEHIWPQSPETYPIDEDDYDALVHRLGNLTFVSDEYNKSALRNKLFDDKRPAFRDSSYRLNRKEIANGEHWGEATITRREDEDLVPFILERWSLET